MIDRLQNYYGIVIRSNVGDLNGMKKAIHASFFHCASSEQHAYLSTLPVLPGVSKFFIKSPGLQVRAPNLPGKFAASFEFFFFINFVVFKMSKRKIKQEVYSVLFFELLMIGKRKTENRAVKLRFI